MGNSRRMARFGERAVVRQRARCLVDQPIHFDLGDALHIEAAHGAGKRLRLGKRGAIDRGRFVRPRRSHPPPQPRGATHRALAQHVHRRTFAHRMAGGHRPERHFVPAFVDGLERPLPRRAADARFRSHRLGQPRSRLPPKRPHRMDEELQQAVRIQRFPDQRQGQLQHLAGGAEGRVVLEPGARQTDALEGVVEDDAVAAGDDDGAPIPALAHDFGNRLRGDVPGQRPNNHQRAVAAQGLRRIAEQQRLQLAEIGLRRRRRRGLGKRLTAQTLRQLPPKQG